MRKKYLVLGVVLGAVGIGEGYYFFFHEKNVPITRTMTVSVQTGSINEVVKTTGKIYPIQNSILSFAKQGNVMKILKNVGDEVKAGDVIAEIDAGSANLDIENAKLSLSNAQNNYDKVAGEGKYTEIIRAENTLEESRAKLVLLQRNRDDMVFSQTNAEKNAEENIKTIENKLVIAQNDYDYEKQSQDTDTDVNNIERDMMSAFLLTQDIYRTLGAINPELKTLLMMDAKNGWTYGDFGSNNYDMKIQMEKSYSGTMDDFSAFEKRLQELQNMDVRTFDSVANLLSAANVLLSKYDMLFSLAVQTVDASPETTAFPRTLHDSMKSTLRGYASQVGTKLSSVNNPLATLKNYGTDDLQSLQKKNTLLQKQNTLKQTENDLEKAKTSLDELRRSNTSALLQSNQSIDSQNNSIRLNESSLNDLKNPNNTELVSAQNSVKSAQINLEKLELALKDYKIIALFDGKVLDIPWTVGSTTTASEGITVSNDNAYEVQVLLDQADIVKVQAGMNARVQLDAFPDVTIPGVISSVSGAPTETSSVVSYSAKILLSGVNEQIFSNMTATVEIIILEKNDILSIPSAAIRTMGEKSVVTVRLSDGQDQVREVEVGLTSGNQTEIVSGLNLGDIIVISLGIDSGSSGSVSSGNMSFGIPGVTPPTGGMGGGMRSGGGGGNFSRSSGGF